MRRARNSARLAFSHELLDLFQPVCPLITRQAVKEYFAILLAHQSLVQDGENAAVFPAANQPAKSLLQRDDGLGDLVIGEGTAPVFVDQADRKSTRLNSSHGYISYAVFCLKKKTRLWPEPDSP